MLLMLMFVLSLVLHFFHLLVSNPVMVKNIAVIRLMALII